MSTTPRKKIARLLRVDPEELVSNSQIDFEGMNINIEYPPVNEKNQLQEMDNT
ncbi:hypothetical protein FACS1894113_0260 [Alphaproteobacteria bacterium]|nr:hypothetical protein FACS1894113_0260 [Alphaproteobacteria bacterium]